MHGVRKLRADTLTPEHLDLLEQLACAEARESFWAYRQFINPGMKIGWWQCTVAQQLQKFYEQLVAGKRPKLLLQSPPQHGKSVQIIDFISWVSGLNPDFKTIFASFSDRLGVRANLKLQRIFESARYQKVFPTRIGDKSSKYLRNHEIIEFVNKDGYFRNTTVNGPVTGETLDLGVIDDPIKGRAEANSSTIRERAWLWLTDDFMTRFSDQAGLLMIMTRWHVDDPAGRMIENFPDLQSLHYPAVAEKNEAHRKKGEPLFPELKPIEFLDQRRKSMTQGSWVSVYQQSPIVVGGGLFPIEKIEVAQQLPASHLIKSGIRYWDKAGTEDGGAFTAGSLVLELKDGTFLVCDVRRGQWAALERERIIKQTAAIDAKLGFNIQIWVEQEPGSGGKESAESTIRMLRGYSVHADKVTGSKEVRAEPYAAQVQAGNVSILAGLWNRSFLDEHEQFPSGKYKDQVDATAGAFNKLTLGSRYLSDLSWVGKVA